jgi:hypothetical protein
MHGITNDCSVKWIVNEISAVNTLVEKENEIFLIYKEIQMGAVTKSYLYEEGLPSS